jgi:uncharacterized protein
MLSPETHIERIASELSLRPTQVRATASLLAEGGTVPFIARYRKEATGMLDEVQIQNVRDRMQQLVELEARRESIVKSLEERNLLTDVLKGKISTAQTMTALEDIYQPYKPKKRTRAMIAKEKGLEPLADQIWNEQESGFDPAAAAITFVNEALEVKTPTEALSGARDILAERISDDAVARAQVRELFLKRGELKSKVVTGKEVEGAKFKDYFDWSEPIANTPSHRILAVRRGETEGFLFMRIQPPEADALGILEKLFVKGSSPAAQQVKLAVQDSYKRLLSLSMETEARMEFKRRADEEAIRVFAENLRELLLASPLGQKNVLAVDPGFRTGCKVVILDRQGKLLYNDVINLIQGDRAEAEAAMKIRKFCEHFKIEAIAIGNGTASRETETFIRSLKLPASIALVMVNESGASIYSASEIARQEFPDHDVTVRGAVSIGRRLMDPLAELVKLDPKSIGVGQYQHDVDQNALKRSLDDVVMSCVNGVGVELNTASAQLLAYVSGLNSGIATSIVAHRNEAGPFKSREDLLKVPRLGPKAYEQAAGFLRIRNASNLLDASAVHPERYALVSQMAADLGCTTEDLIKDEKRRAQIKLERYVQEDVGMPTLKDIVNELAKPGRDPRQKFEAFAFDSSVHEPKDLKPGMKLPGIVTNVTAFGAFVDVGVHQDGLVHVSQLSDTFVKNPAEVVKVSQKVTVTVMEVDLERGRIGLSMKSKPDLTTGGSRGGGPRPAGAPDRRPMANSGPRPAQSLSGDWFSEALNKKR